MVTKRESVSTKQYPANDSKFPARAARGVEPMLPLFKPIIGQLGPYELVCELGSGGMGTVYVARRTYEGGVTRTVALKTLRKDLAYQADLVEMFMDEARITSRISHPYVCTVMDIGSADGVPFVTMDYLIGEPLSRLAPLMAAEQTEASVASILRVIANLCEGLHAAHEQRDESGTAMQVVHRDISPDNLFVLYDGSVRVADFGIACTAEHQKSGKASALAGKSGYMSPEQIRGQLLDRRADVWSMGVVLWELLTGKRLFRPGSEVAATVAVLERPIDSPSKFNKLVPSGLDAVVRRALHRDRDHRYPTARAMALELENVLTRCFGPVSAARLSGWLDDLFPGCQEFRRTIVPRSQAWIRSQKNLEFDLSNPDGVTPGIIMVPGSLELLSRMPGGFPAAPSNFNALGSSTMDLDGPDETSIVPVVTGTAPLSLDALSLAPEEPKRPRVPPPPTPVSPEPAQAAQTPEPVATVQSLPPHRKFVRTLAAAFAGGLALAGAIALLSSSARQEPQAAKPAPVAKSEPVTQVVTPPAPAPVAAPAPAVAAAAAPEPPALTPLPALVAEPVVDKLPEPQAPVTAPVAAKPHPRPSVAKPTAPVLDELADVYVYASSGEYFVLVNGRTMHAPASFKVPVETRVLFVRKGVDGQITKVPIKPVAGAAAMVKLD